MKYLLIISFLLSGFAANAQTIHTDDDQIVYKGKVKLKTGDKSVIMERITKELPDLLVDEEIKTDADTLRTKGAIILNSPYHLVRKVVFDFTVKPDEKGYAYRLDKVFVIEKERGGKTRKAPGAALLKNMEESGLLAQRTEEVLNEIDMRIQKLLAVLKKTVKQ